MEIFWINKQSAVHHKSDECTSDGEQTKSPASITKILAGLFCKMWPVLLRTICSIAVDREGSFCVIDNPASSFACSLEETAADRIIHKYETNTANP